MIEDPDPHDKPYAPTQHPTRDTTYWCWRCEVKVRRLGIVRVCTGIRTSGYHHIVSRILFQIKLDSQLFGGFWIRCRWHFGLAKGYMPTKMGVIVGILSCMQVYESPLEMNGA